MNEIIIYTTARCPYCENAKKLFDAIAQPYKEVRVDQAPDRLNEMVERSGGRRSFPQILINGKAIGGFDDLHALQQSGELSQLLNNG